LSPDVADVAWNIAVSFKTKDSCNSVATQCSSETGQLIDPLSNDYTGGLCPGDFYTDSEKNLLQAPSNTTCGCCQDKWALWSPNNWAPEFDAINVDNGYGCNSTGYVKGEGEERRTGGA